MGKIIKPYELISQLGQGGMGVVYKAQSLNLRTKVVAIKQLWQQYSQNPVFVKAFLEEGEKLFLLDHKNIVKVTDILEENGEYYIVMEFVEGRTLSEIIRKETGPIERKRAIKLFRQMLEGVAYIHSQPKPIIHRDIKPLNLLVTEDDTVKITDFGIAKVLDAGQNTSTVVKGTPVYMSPEQILNPKSVDIRTDVYSLGMTFYEMLCGRTPFSGDTATSPTAVYAAIMNGEVQPPTHFYPGIMDALSDFVMKAIHKDRNQRFSNANEMLRELERLENSGATTFQEVSKFEPPVATPMAKKEEVPFESTSQPTLIESKEADKNELDSEDRSYMPKEIEINKNNIWKLIAGFVVMVGIILAITSSKGKKALSPAMYSVKVETPENTLTAEQQKEMVLVEGGTFEMGSSEVKYDDERPVHTVKVGSFLIGKYEVTQALWESVMGSNPSIFKGSSRPVESISWYDAVEFCNKLSEKEGLQKSYSGSGSSISCDFNANGYRLPTEAEWEYAARGGKKSKGYKYSGSNIIDEVAWYGDNSGREPHEAGTKQPNELGLYDMSGNVWEWCWDWYGTYTSANQPNPKGANAGSTRIDRGGGWDGGAEYCRVAFRFYSFSPERRHAGIGFRVVRTKN